MPGIMKALFATILPGENVRARVIACVGAFVGISLAGLIAAVSTGGSAAVPLLIAPMGASAVLLFAVPSSPLAQPWSIVGGSIISAAIGVTVAMVCPNMTIAAGIAVGLAIGAMSLARCLHPPGGAVALLPVLASIHGTPVSYGFLVLPVGVSAVLLTLVGYSFHRLARQPYPHPPHALSAPVGRSGFTAADVDAALQDLGETLDIDRADLERLLQQVERRARDRHRA
jgi:CBS domain-containing membrane protein